VTDKLDIRAHQLVWEAVGFYLDIRRSEGATVRDATVEIAAALMDSAARVNIVRGLDSATYAKIAGEHYQQVQDLMREDLARTSN
jgi:hypothetical protein